MALKRSPARRRLVPELARLQLRDDRELIIRPYRFPYRTAGRSVFVFAILNARRDLEDIFLDRLLQEYEEAPARSRPERTASNV